MSIHPEESFAFQVTLLLGWGRGVDMQRNQAFAALIQRHKNTAYYIATQHEAAAITVLLFLSLLASILPNIVSLSCVYKTSKYAVLCI